MGTVGQAREATRYELIKPSFPRSLSPGCFMTLWMLIGSRPSVLIFAPLEPFSATEAKQSSLQGCLLVLHTTGWFGLPSLPIDNDSKVSSSSVLLVL